jgi:hypothetical protein
MSSVHDEAIRQFRRTLKSLLALRLGVILLTAWAFSWGAIVLVARAMLAVPRTPLLWGAAALPLLLVATLWHVRRRLPSPTALRALLDQHNACGGLLMTAEVCPLDSWQEQLPAIQAPELHWRGRRFALPFVAAIAFLLLCFLLPDRYAVVQNASALEIGTEADRLAKQVDILKEEGFLEPQRAESFQKKLEQLKQNASGKDPVKTLEALDHLQEMTAQTAREAAESSLKKTQNLAKAESLAHAVEQMQSELDPKTLSEAMKELSSMARDAAAESAAVQKELDPETRKALRENAISSKDLKKLASAMSKGKNDVMRRLEKLNKGRLVDRETLAECTKCSQCNSNKVGSGLKRRAGSSNRSAKGTARQDQNRGASRDVQGERDEGGTPGTPLSFGEPSSEEGLKFKEKILPPGDVRTLKESELVGLSQQPPEAKPGGPSASGALKGAAAGGGSANTQIILPKHRGAVERFFKRP